MLSDRRYMALYRKTLQKSLRLRATLAGGVTQAIEANEVTYPIAVSLDGARTVAFSPQPQ